jgi:hypothetical protein
MRVSWFYWCLFYSFIHLNQLSYSIIPWFNLIILTLFNLLINQNNNEPYKINLNFSN